VAASGPAGEGACSPCLGSSGTLPSARARCLADTSHPFLVPQNTRAAAREHVRRAWSESGPGTCLRRAKCRTEQGEQRTLLAGSSRLLTQGGHSLQDLQRSKEGLVLRAWQLHMQHASVQYTLPFKLLICGKQNVISTVHPLAHRVASNGSPLARHLLLLVHHEPVQQHLGSKAVGGREGHHQDSRAGAIAVDAQVMRATCAIKCTLATKTILHRCTHSASQPLPAKPSQLPACRLTRWHRSCTSRSVVLTYSRAPNRRAVALCPVRVALMHTIRMGWHVTAAWLLG